MSSASQENESLIGRLLDGRYQITQALSQGGFGHTYLAQDTRRPGHPICVVKHLQPATNQAAFLQTARRLFKSEAETLEKLGCHDQIPRLLAYFEEQEEFYLVEEYIAGNPLGEEFVVGQRWREDQVIAMLQDVLLVLEFVHDNDVIHRDIKPDNLIRRQSDQKLVLVDFGAVKQVKTQAILLGKKQNHETVAVGTPGYMPSEQSQGRPRPSSDIYALGIIAIQALTGLRPTYLAEDPTTGEICWQQYAQVSDRLAAVLNKMVRHYFKYRYQSAREVLNALDHLGQSSPVALLHTVNTLGRNYLGQLYQASYHLGQQALQGLNTATTPVRPLPSAFAQPLNQTLPLPDPEAPGDGSETEANAAESEANLPQPRAVPKTLAIAPRLSSIFPASTQLLAPAPLAQKLQALPPSVKIALGIAALSLMAGNLLRPPSTPAPTTAAITSPTASPTPAPTPTPSAPPSPAEASPAPTPGQICAIAVKPSNVRVSAGGARSGQVVAAGTKLILTGKEQDGWIETMTPVKGWVWEDRIARKCS